MEHLNRDEVKEMLKATMADNECSITFLGPSQSEVPIGGDIGAANYDVASNPLYGQVAITIESATGIRQVPQKGGMLGGMFSWQDPYVSVRPLWGDQLEQVTGSREFSARGCPRKCASAEYRSDA